MTGWLNSLTPPDWRKLEQAILSWRAEPTQRRSKDLFQRIKIYRGYWSLPTGSLGGHLMSTMSPTVLCDLFEAAELYDLGNAVHLARMVDFYKTVRMALADVVRGPDQLHAGDEVVLAAPDALFACKHCGGITAWPAVFDHECDFIDDWAAEPVRVRILDHFEAAPAAICGLARDIASSYDDDSPSSPADLQALGAVFVLQPIARMKRKPQRFLAFVRHNNEACPLTWLS